MQDTHVFGVQLRSMVSGDAVRPSSTVFIKNRWPSTETAYRAGKPPC
jgi:hypothetical protein